MNPIIEVVTDTSSASYMQFNRFHLFRKNWYLVWMFPVLFLLIGFAAYMDGEPVKGIVFAVIALVMPLFMLLVMRLSAKRHLKSNKIYTSLNTIQYRMDEEKLYQESMAADIKATFEAGWSKVHRVYETKDSFYIYISNMQALILPKKDFTVGSPDRLAELIVGKVDPKHFKRMQVRP